MLSKKHLGPNACASCEQNLVNMHGTSADYYNWKKLPARETNERIARYGQGFSKILSTLRDDIGQGSLIYQVQERKSLHSKKQSA